MGGRRWGGEACKSIGGLSKAAPCCNLPSWGSLLAHLPSSPGVSPSATTAPARTQRAPRLTPGITCHVGQLRGLQAVWGLPVLLGLRPEKGKGALLNTVATALIPGAPARAAPFPRQGEQRIRESCKDGACTARSCPSLLPLIFPPQCQLWLPAQRGAQFLLGRWMQPLAQFGPCQNQQLPHAPAEGRAQPSAGLHTGAPAA